MKATEAARARNDAAIAEADAAYQARMTEAELLRGYGATGKYDREVLLALLEAAELYGRDTSDHRCYPTEHEPAFWNAVRDAREYVREAQAREVKS